MGIALQLAYSNIAEVQSLFSQYTQMLIATNPAMADCLAHQDYDSELSQLTTRYGLPRGRFYLAYSGQTPAGCIGLKPLEGGVCEMKRLYVPHRFRGRGVGRILVAQILADAREIGYSAMVLDTLPQLKSAIGLYQSFGFYETPSYNDNPVEDVVYLRADL